MKAILYLIGAALIGYFGYQHFVIGEQERQANIKYLDARQAILFKNNYKKGIPLLQELADMNYGLAVYNLGVIYEKGKGIKKDLPKARTLYKKALPILSDLSENGDTMAKGYIGEMYLYGRGVSKNRSKAMDIFNSIDDPKYQDYKEIMLKK